MQSRLFGVAWVVHQTLPRYIATLAPKTVQNDAVVRASISLETYALSRVLPCKFCRESYVEFLERANFKERIQTRRTLPLSEHENFWFEIHNLVNAKLAKPVLTEKEPAYTNKIAKSSVDFVFALLDWLCMIALNQAPILEEQEKKNLETLLKFIAKNNNLLPYQNVIFNFRQVLDSQTVSSVVSTRAWVAAYIYSIIRLLLNCKKDTKLVNFARKLAGSLSTASVWETAETLFLALYDVRIYALQHLKNIEYSILPKELDLYLHFDSYRAGKCVGNSCTL